MDMTDYIIFAAPFFPPTLKDTTTWGPWFAIIRGIADQCDVWELCDPDKEVEPKLPEKPEKPCSMEEAKEKYKDDWYHCLKSERADWTTADATYSQKRRGFYSVAIAIRGSVHPDYQFSIIDDETPWQLLRNLRKRFSPDCDRAYAAMLRRQRRNLNRRLHR